MGGKADIRAARTKAGRRFLFSREEGYRAARRRRRELSGRIVFGLFLFAGFAAASGYAGSSLVKGGSVDLRGVSRLFAFFVVSPLIMLAVYRLIFRYFVPVALLIAWKTLDFWGLNAEASPRELLKSEKVWFFASDGRLANFVERLIRGEAEGDRNA